MTTLDELFGARLALVVPEVVTGATAAAARAAFERAGYTRFALLDRGSYEVIDDPDARGLIDVLVALAQQRTGRMLVVDAARVLRLEAGDYVLAHHDRIHAGHPLEVALDLSVAGVPGAEIHYRRRGQVYFRVACVPGAASIVERGPTVTCNHTYVSKLVAGASVVRLIVLLRDA